MLSVGGFVNSTGGPPPAQPDSAITAVFVASTVIPALAPLLSIVFRARYRLDESTLQAMPEPRSEAQG
jgi:Na+/melibiose symporter-like transporter